MKPRLCAPSAIAALVISTSFLILAQVRATAQGSADSSPSAGEVRFSVALQLSGSWCYGYLYGSADKIRFEVVQPQSNKNASFDLPRREVTLAQWVILGVPQDAIELRTRSTTYHMRWLANEGEVQTGAARRWAPPVSLPPYQLMAAMQNPAAALAQRGSQPADRAFHATGSAGAVARVGSSNAAADPGSAGPAAPPDNGPHDVPPGMLAGVYVGTADAGKPSNTQYLFYPDGSVMNGVPQKGMLSFDLNHYRPQDNPDRNWWGHYRVKGDTIEIVWQNQFGDPANPAVIQRNESQAHPAFQVGPTVFIPMCHCTGKRLSGIYRWGAPAQDQYIQFFPDGTFLDHRATDELLVINFEHPRTQRGSYQIVDQTIIFSFPDGHRGTNSFLAPKVQKDDPTFDWISFGWHMFFEEGYRAKLSRGW